MTDHNNDNKGAGLAGGIFLGILLTLVVGAGACYLMFNPISSGSNDSYEPEYSQTEISSLQQLYDKATKPTPDPEASWLLSLAILEPEARRMLELDMTDEQAKAAAATYYNQALKAGFPTALVAEAYQSVNSGLGLEIDPDNEDLEQYQITEIKSAQQVETGLKQIVAVLKKNCEVYAIDNSHLEYVLDAYTHTIPLDFDSLSQEAIRPYPILADLMDIAKLREAIYCQCDDAPERQLLELLLDKQVYTSDWHTPLRQLIYSSVLAELLDKPDIVYLINRRVPAEAQNDFIKERSALLTAYKTAFGDQIPVDAVEGNQ